MSTRSCTIAVAIWLTAAATILASDALAQERGGIRLGAVLLSPAITNAGVGYDSNVFNDSVNPRDDLTATFSPDLQISMTAGRSRLSGTTGLNFLYFREYASQRSVGTANTLRWEFAANRLRPFAAFSFTDQTTRPTPEINTRVRNHLRGSSAGMQIRVAPRASLVFEGSRNRTTYDDEAQFLGNDLSQELNQTVNSVSGSLWYDLTPLTKFTLTADAQSHRYDTSGPRDARSYGLESGFEFAPTALIRGAATVGFRHLNVRDSTVPDYRGLVMSVDLTYVLRGTTKFAVRASRDTAPSLAELQPYYVQTVVTASVRQQLTSVWDVFAQAGRDKQDYQRSDKSDTRLIEPLSNRFQYTLQGGMGFRLGRTIIMSIYVDSYRRQSAFQANSKTTRVMTSFSYTL